MQSVGSSGNAEVSSIDRQKVKLLWTNLPPDPRNVTPTNRASRTPKKAADNEVLYNLNAPPSQAEIRLRRLQVRISKSFSLPSLFVVLKRVFKLVKRRYFGFYTEAYCPVSLTRMSMHRNAVYVVFRRCQTHSLPLRERLHVPEESIQPTVCKTR